jgi:hypothetical protein
MKIHGRCHCGRVSYEAEADPNKVGICHCTDCQTFSGSPWRASIAVEAANFKLTGEPPKLYIKTAASGRQRAQAFCEVCGSAIYASTPENQQVYNLRLGAIAERAQLPPKVQTWCSSALPWSSNIADLPVV